MYRSTNYLTSALDGVSGQRQVLAVLPPGKTRCPLYRRLGGPQSRSGRVRKIFSLPGFDPLTVQPVASRCCVDSGRDDIQSGAKAPLTRQSTYIRQFCCFVIVC
jgi:hypothetical protein